MKIAAYAAALAGLAACVGSCSNHTADAEERYRIVEQAGDKKEICRQARAVQDAYLQDKNDAKYREWKLTADIDCMTARMSAD